MRSVKRDTPIWTASYNAALCLERQRHPGPQIPGAVFQRAIVTEISSAEIHTNHSSGILLTVLPVLLGEGSAPEQGSRAEAASPKPAPLALLLHHGLLLAVESFCRWLWHEGENYLIFTWTSATPCCAREFDAEWRRWDLILRTSSSAPPWAPQSICPSFRPVRVRTWRGLWSTRWLEPVWCRCLTSAGPVLALHGPGCGWASPGTLRLCL